MRAILSMTLIMLYLLLPYLVAASTISENKAYAREVAQEYGLNEDHFLTVIGCESRWNEESVGDYGTSFGLAQLHNPRSDWGVSSTEAKDPHIALPIMAKAWVRGEASRWSCWSRRYI